MKKAIKCLIVVACLVINAYPSLTDAALTHYSTTILGKRAL